MRIILDENLINILEKYFDFEDMYEEDDNDVRWIRSDIKNHPNFPQATQDIIDTCKFIDRTTYAVLPINQYSWDFHQKYLLLSDCLQVAGLSLVYRRDMKVAINNLMSKIKRGEK